MEGCSNPIKKINIIYALNSMKIKILPIEISDLRSFLSVRNQCIAYLHCNKIFKFEEAEEWFQSNHVNYLKILVDDIFAGYFRTDYDSENSALLIGADLDEKYRGLGIARSAYSELIEVIFNDFCTNRIWLEVLATNTRAISLYKSLSFRSEGIKRGAIRRQEKFVDSLIFSRLKNDSII